MVEESVERVPSTVPAPESMGKDPMTTGPSSSLDPGGKICARDIYFIGCLLGRQGPEESWLLTSIAGNRFGPGVQHVRFQSR